MSTSKVVKSIVPTFKGATAKMYDMLVKAGAKGLTHTQIQKFKKDNELSGAYLILFRLRKIGRRTKSFTIQVMGEGSRADRTYRLVKGVVKGDPTSWPKAFPVRTAKPVVKAAAKSTTKKATVKPATKKAVKSAPKPKKVAVTVGADDDAVLE